MLDEPGLAAEAPRWWEIADRWHALAETALPVDVPAFARPGAHRHGHRSCRRGRRRPRSGPRPLRSSGGCGPHADAPPLAEELAAVLAGMSGHLAEIHEAEKAAIQRLGAVMRIQSRR